jgi:hypothetical protein
MTDEELVEALRRTFRERADSFKPSSAGAPAPRAKSRKFPRPGRRLVGGSLAAAVAAAAAAAIVTLNNHPSPAHNVSIAGPVSTLPPTGAAAKPVPPTSSPLSSSPSGPASSVTSATTPPVPAPAGFRPQSVTFVSARSGWVLGTAPCGSTTCATLVRTTDGGATWTLVAQPPVAVSSSAAARPWVRFLNLDIGWIVAPSGSQASVLWTTDNGGKDWTQEVNPGGGSATVLALEASNGLVHLVDLETGTGSDRIYTSPAGRPDWKLSPAAPSFGAGPVPSAQMTLFANAGWVVNVNRTVVSGARLSPQAEWASWTPPCANAHGSGYLAASSSLDLYAVCDEGIWGSPAAGTTPSSEWLYASTDGGDSFSLVGPLPQNTSSGPIAVPPGTTTVVGATGTGIIATFDGGRSWQTVSNVAGLSYVGFTTATQGVAISEQVASSSVQSTSMLMTWDGGRTWVPVAF